MYGAILGDMIGAPYEFDRGNKTKDIYFDITDFFNGAHVEFTHNNHKYAERKIRDIYKKH